MLYLIFTTSWFLHLPLRIPGIGVIRPDLLMIIVLAVMAYSRRGENDSINLPVEKLLRILIIYSLVTIPLVEWPGSVLKQGFPDFIKAVVFYYFTAAFIRNETELKRFVYLFLACQMFRVLEPLYLHITTGYWGSVASMSGWQHMDRLSGSPHDTVNPNGLAYIICTVLPFLYYMQNLSWKHRAAFLLCTPAALYALMLTGSRSGMLALAVVYSVVVYKSRHRALLIMAGVVAVIAGFASLDPVMQDRYLSTFGMGELNAVTADERLQGMKEQFRVMMHRPIFGHGLGTSPEANYHFTGAGPYGGMALPAHNLFLEAGQEIGLIGTVIFILFIKAIIQMFIEHRKTWSRYRNEGFINSLINAMQVWIAMNIVFSFASYGLSSYDWYLFAGLSVVLKRLSLQHDPEQHAEAAPPARHRRYAPARSGLPPGKARLRRGRKP